MLKMTCETIWSKIGIGEFGSMAISMIQPALQSVTRIQNTRAVGGRMQGKFKSAVKVDRLLLLRHDAQGVVRLGGVKLSATRRHILEPQFVHEARPHLCKSQRHPSRVGGDGHI